MVSALREAAMRIGDGSARNVAGTGLDSVGKTSNRSYSREFGEGGRALGLMYFPNVPPGGKGEKLLMSPV